MLNNLIQVGRAMRDVCPGYSGLCTQSVVYVGVPSNKYIKNTICLDIGLLMPTIYKYDNLLTLSKKTQNEPRA